MVGVGSSAASRPRMPSVGAWPKPLRVSSCPLTTRSRRSTRSPQQPTAQWSPSSGQPSRPRPGAVTRPDSSLWATRPVAIWPPWPCADSLPPARTSSPVRSSPTRESRPNGPSPAPGSVGSGRLPTVTGSGSSTSTCTTTPRRATLTWRRCLPMSPACRPRRFSSVVAIRWSTRVSRMRRISGRRASPWISTCFPGSSTDSSRWTRRSCPAAREALGLVANAIAHT